MQGRKNNEARACARSSYVTRTMALDRPVAGLAVRGLVSEPGVWTDVGVGRPTGLFPLKGKRTGKEKGRNS